MYCVKCGNLIPEARLKALPTAKTCVHCSSAQRVAGFPLITGKTEYSALPNCFAAGCGPFAEDAGPAWYWRIYVDDA